MSNEMIGPSLPPNWNKDRKDDHKKDNKKVHKKDDHRVYGPTLPPILPTVNRSPKPSPKVPPNVLSKASTSRSIGPSIPSDFNRSKSLANDSDSDSDDLIGPILPTDHNFDKIDAKFGDVSEILAQKEAQNEEKMEREEWMTIAPKQLTSKIPTKSVKHFSQRPVKSNDKNSDKKYKSNDKRDRELSQIMDSFNKSQKRDVSLIDIHKNESKKAKKSEEEEEERVPFDREKDLSVRRMDSRQTKSVLNKAKTFNDRFSLGINKFL